MPPRAVIRRDGSGSAKDVAGSSRRLSLMLQAHEAEEKALASPPGPSSPSSLLSGSGRATSSELASARWDAARKATLKRQSSVERKMPVERKTPVRRGSNERRGSMKPSVVPTTVGESLEVKHGDRVRI